MDETRFWKKLVNFKLKVDWYMAKGFSISGCHLRQINCLIEQEPTCLLMCQNSHRTGKINSGSCVTGGIVGAGGKLTSGKFPQRMGRGAPFSPFSAQTIPPANASYRFGDQPISSPDLSPVGWGEYVDGWPSGSALWKITFLFDRSAHISRYRNNFSFRETNSFQRSILKATDKQNNDSLNPYRSS